MNSEPRRRRRDFDRDRDKDRDRDRDRNRDKDYYAYSPRSKGQDYARSPHQSRRTRSRDREREGDDDESNSYSSDSAMSQDYSPRKSATARPGPSSRKTSSSLLERTRSSQSYPSFSKAHSRETTTGQPDNDIRTSSKPHTPDATDLNDDRTCSPRRPRRKHTNTGAPPSPPLTTVDAHGRRAGSGGSLRDSRMHPMQGPEDARRSLDTLNLPRDGVRFSASRYSLREAEEGRSSVNITPNSSAAGKSDTARSASGRDPKSRTGRSPFTGSPTRNAHSRQRSGLQGNNASVDSSLDSDATPVPEGSFGTRATTIINSSQDSTGPNGAWAERTGRPPASTPIGSGAKIEVFASMGSESEFAEPLDTFETMASDMTAQAHAPPPPPSFEPTEIPRINYLLHNGGLPAIIKKPFSKAPEAILQQGLQKSKLSSPTISTLQSVFVPYQVVLDNLDQVLSRNGSVAVATGYDSEARKLQERLKAFFERDITEQVCTCVMCELERQKYDSQRPADVGWEELLDLAHRRTQLPPWPPFVLPTAVNGLGIDLDRAATPMQKLDIDVPEEFREHFLRQSTKTKNAVQHWLEDQPEEGPPADVDDETLTFAMLTYLAPEDRRLFATLSRGHSTIATSRASTPAQVAPKSDLVSRIGIALQRLYNLSKLPREPESYMYLLRNPTFHNALVTIAGINAGEWEMLISGQVAGPRLSTIPFANGTTSTTPSTPFSPTLGGVPLPTTSITQSSQVESIQKDEESEMHMLSTVERDIYLGMEALEDAFEQLHLKAEAIRKRLLERSAGLAAGARQREGQSQKSQGINGAATNDDIPSARLDTPVLSSQVTNPNTTAAQLNGAQSNPLLTHLTNSRGLTPAPSTPLLRTPDPDWNATGAFGGFDDAASLIPDDSASNIGWRERERRQRERIRSAGGWGGRGLSERERDGGRVRQNGIAGNSGGAAVSGDRRDGKDGSGMGTGIGLGGLGKRLTRRLRSSGDVVRQEM